MGQARGKGSADTKSGGAARGKPSHRSPIETDARPHLTIRGNRARVLNVLQRNKQPMTAYEIMHELRKSGTCWPITVYRALDQLMSLGLVHRMASRAAFMACTRATTSGEIHVVAVCDRCGIAEEFPVPSVLPETLRASQGRSFEVTGLSLEVRGVCARCVR